MFINTTQSTGDELKTYRGAATRQEDKVLAHFKAGGDHTPSEVWKSGILGDAPLTSVRRAISCLTDAEELSKTTKQRKGLYNKPEFVWTLALGQQELFDVK